MLAWLGYFVRRGVVWLVSEGIEGVEGIEGIERIEGIKRGV